MWLYTLYVQFMKLCFLLNLIQIYTSFNKTYPIEVASLTYERDF